MKNVTMTTKEEVLTITVDLSKDFGPSKSGKTVMVATTAGNVEVPGKEKFKVGLNVYKK